MIHLVTWEIFILVQVVVIHRCNVLSVLTVNFTKYPFLVDKRDTIQNTVQFTLKDAIDLYSQIYDNHVLINFTNKIMH